MLSMLHAAVERDDAKEIWFIHAALNGENHAFEDEVLKLAEKHPKVHVHFCYSEPTQEDREKERFDSEGFVDQALLTKLLKEPTGEFYFCGPKPMMQCVFGALTAWGVPESHLRYEFFGPAQAIREAVVA